MILYSAPITFALRWCVVNYEGHHTTQCYLIDETQNLDNHGIVAERMLLFNAASETDGAENMPLLASQLFQMQWIVRLYDMGSIKF